MKLVHDRRGVTAMIFAVSAVALLGLVALATEAGAWYVARVKVYNVADAAAVAAILAASTSQDPAAAANDVAKANGLTAPVVVSAGSDSNGDPQLQSTVSMSFVPLLSAVFGVSNPVTVSASAVARLQTFNNACVVSLAGQLTITQSQFSLANSNCVYGSNDSADQSGVIISDSSVNLAVGGITAVQDCSGCPNDIPLVGGASAANSNTGMNQPYASFQPPTTIDRFAEAVASTPVGTITNQLIAISTPTVAPASANPSGDGRPITTISSQLLPAMGGSLADGTTCKASPPASYCAYMNVDVVIPSGTVVTMSPGTYIFYNSSLNVENSASLQCSWYSQDPQFTAPCNELPSGNGYRNLGVTILMIGSPGHPTGSLTINPKAQVSLSAQMDDDLGWSGMAGILIYRDQNGAPDTDLSPGIYIADDATINGAGNTFLDGVVYAPNSHVWFSTNYNPSYLWNCSMLVAGTITLGSRASDTPGQTFETQFTDQYCTDPNRVNMTAVPQQQVVSVVQ